MNDTTSGYGFEDLAPMIRVQAKGIWHLEAAAELLIGHQTWLLREDFTAGFVTVEHDAGRGFAQVDYAAAVHALECFDLPCSGSEANILRIAASLATNVTVNLGQRVGGLDAQNTRLVLEAIAHANGYRNAQVRL